MKEDKKPKPVDTTTSTSKYKQFSAKSILPKELLSLPISQIADVANWVEENEIEGDMWEFVQAHATNGVEILLKRKS